MTYQEAAELFKAHNLHDITPERSKNSIHFYDPVMSSDLVKFFYVFNPNTGMIRQRRDYYHLGKDGKLYPNHFGNHGHVINQYHRVPKQYPGFTFTYYGKQFIPITGLVDQMLYALEKIENYRKNPRKTYSPNLPNWVAGRAA
jgi:hypothetical protein